MKILITGGAGYLGSELVRALSIQPDVESVVVYDNLMRENFNLFISGMKLSSKIRFVLGIFLIQEK